MALSEQEPRAEGVFVGPVVPDDGIGGTLAARAASAPRPRISKEEAVTQPATWATLGRPAKAYRLFHTAWSVAGLGSLGYIWACAATGRRDRRLWAGIGFLLVEGAGLMVGGGDCPLGPFQEELGDPVPFFELVLPPRAAKAAVPILAAATVAGIAAVLLRRPNPARRRSSRAERSCARLERTPGGREDRTFDALPPSGRTYEGGRDGCRGRESSVG